MSVMPKQGEFCWNELATANVKQAKDFYGKVFGWTFTDQEIGDMNYTVIKINDRECCGIWEIPKEQQAHIPPHWMSYILVENLQKSLELASKNGAKVIKPSTKVGDMGLLAVIQDPTGAHIALWEPLNANS